MMYWALTAMPPKPNSPMVRKPVKISQSVAVGTEVCESLVT